MLDMDKLEFLNVVQYVEEQKKFIELLYSNQKIVMSSAARNDLSRINTKQITSTFSIPALAEWQKGNILLGIKTYLDYVNSASLIAQDIATSDTPVIQKALNTDELQLVRATLTHWDSFCNLFYDQIENIDTLKVILRSAEKQRAINLGRETTLEPNDVAALYGEKISRVCNYLAERIRSLETISPVISGDVIEQSLKTSLTLEEFRTIVNQLVDARYVAAEFKTNQALTEQWYYYTLNTGKQIIARKCAMKWISTTISLAQFIMTLRSAGAIEYKEQEFAALYRWVHRCFDYVGEPSTMEADIRRALTVKHQSFAVVHKQRQSMKFIINHLARTPKSS